MSTMRAPQPELLDRLPADDPRAIRSRRDLQTINGWMRQARIMEQALRPHWTAYAPCRLLDLGAGDGTFLLRVARRLPAWRNVTATLLDRQDIVAEETRGAFSTLGWTIRTARADVQDFLQGMETTDVVTANLFLHHFGSTDLAQMLARLAQRASLVVACEPRRDAFAAVASRMVWALNCNEVSRHDAAVSVQAGFSGHELSDLWPSRDGWELQEYSALPFSHCFVARRSASCLAHVLIGEPVSTSPGHALGAPP
jgi:SAM-dependent methyltransferase